MYDPSGDTKSVDDMVFYEVSNIIRFNFSKLYNFHPLWKVISYHKDEPMTSSRWRIDRSYYINSSSFKWRWSNYAMQQL